MLQALLFSLAAFAAPELSDRIQVSDILGPPELEVTRRVGGKKEKVRKGESLFVGDELETAVRQILVLQSYDGGQWKIAPGTKFKVEDRKPDKQTLSYWSFQVVKGSMWGAIPKDGKNKDGFRLKVHTKSAAMGIRGTEYLFAGDDKLSTLDVLEGTVWWGKNTDFAPGTYREVTAGNHAELGEDGRIVITPSDPDKAALVKKYHLALSEEGGGKPRGTAQQCLALGKGWKSLDGSNVGECLAHGEESP